MKKIFVALALTLALALALVLMRQAEKQTPLSLSGAVFKTEEKAASGSAFSQSPTQTTDQDSSEDFKTLARQVLDELPTVSDLRKLTAEEAHHTPAILFEAANSLSDVAEALDARLRQTEKDTGERAKVIQDGLAFYQECLNGNERPDSVRALCYTHYRELRKESGKPETQEEAQLVPAQVRSLVDFLAS